MNDEQKAKELFQKYKVSTLYHPITNEKLYDACIEMAKWKEQQCVEKVLEFVSEHFYNHPHDSHLVCSDSFRSVSDLMEQIEETIKKDEKK